MGYLDLPDVRRDEDAQTSRRGGITHSEYYDIVQALELGELQAIAEAAYVVVNALEAIEKRGGHLRPGTAQNLADILRVGLRPSGRPKASPSEPK